MSLPPEMLENFKYFISEVLPSAKTYKHWTRTDINRSWFWALYCEKVFVKLQANADYLSGCRKPLAVLLPGLPFDEVEAKLKDATVALNRALLQNPYLSEEAFHELLALNSSRTCNFIECLQPIAAERVMVTHFLQSLAQRRVQSTCVAIWVAFLNETIAEVNASDLIDNIMNFFLESHDSLCILLAVFSQVIKDTERYDALFKMLISSLGTKLISEDKRNLISVHYAKLERLAEQSSEFAKLFHNTISKEEMRMQ